MKLFFFSIVFFFCFASNASAQDISAQKIKQHVAFLASDKLHGRGTGTADEKKAAQYIAEQFMKIGLTPKGDNATWFHHFSFRQILNPHGIVDTTEPETKSENVVGFLDNKAAFTIVIGAHYDHLGNTDGEGSSLDANPNGKIHNGADDNASGTAGVIELARYFKNNDKQEPYNFLFICFSGEELGLIGSKKFCESPTIALDSVNYFINMDMIGRYRTEKGLLVQGVGTAALWSGILDYLPTDMHIIRDSSGVGPSDYTSFYLKKIPVLGFFTGQHSDYHKPSDDTQLINFVGEKHVLEYIARLAEATCTFDRMTYQETKQPDMGTRAFKVTLGVMPDYSYDKKGLRLDGVTDGKPASKAGLKTGDIVLKLGDYDVENIYGYMDALANYNKGDTVKVVVKRNNEEKIFEVKF